LATTLTYDALVLATGSRLRVPDIPGAAYYAYSNDTFADTVRLDRHLATLTPETAKVVVVGAGFTGLETATQLRQRLGEDACIVLVDQAPATDGALGPGPQPVVAKALADCRIETRASAEIVEIRKESIVLRDGEFITADAVVLTTGLEASPLTRAIAAKCDAAGRIRVSPDLQVPAIDGVFAAGDTAHAFADDAHVASMSCQHAIQLGRFAGHNAIRYLLGLNTRPYRQERYVTCLDLGPDGAMFSSGWQRVVLKTGAEAKAIKRQINRERIYPPLPSLPQHEIFAQAGLNQDAPPV
jgi:NADH dehydrogenase